MTFAADIFRDCSSGLSLSGGRAAARFSTELGRSAQCHQSVSHGSSWIGSLFAATPRLSAGLNYDGVLVPLLSAILSPQERQSAHPVARRSPARPTLVPSGGHSRGAADFHGGARNPAGPASLPAAGPVSRAQAAAPATSVSPSRGIAPADLVRLAESSGRGGGAAAAVTKKGRLPSTNSYAYRRESGTAAASVVASSVLPGSLLSPAAAGSSAAAAGGLPTPAAIRDWQSRMVERVRGRLRSSFGGYGAVAGASDALQDVWGLPINGPAASPEMLVPDAGLCAASASTLLHDTDSPSAAEPFITPAAPAPPAVAGPAGAESGAKVGRAAVLENVVASPEGAALGALQVMGEELLSKANDDLWVPSLIPSRRPGEAPYVSSPASLARTEIAPLSQDMDLGEDLTDLSVKMKRVLNEEARRHGIDV